LTTRRYVYLEKFIYSAPITNKIQNAAKLGLAVAIESADEAIMEQQEQQGAAVSAGAIPF
jgi:mitochondrial import receptor subunit TOM40